MLAFQLKKTDYETKVNKIEKKISDHSHGKQITTPEFNKLTGENFVARLAQENLVTKTDLLALSMNHIIAMVVMV